jgi:hypothetical protein
VITDEFHDFFIAAAGAAGALVGLLFVAVSVAPDQIVGPAAPLRQQTRASTALTALSTPLIIALVALIPGSNPGWAALAVGVLNLLTTITAIRRLAVDEQAHGPLTWVVHSGRSMLGFVLLMFLDFAAGLVLILHSSSEAAIDVLSAAIIASLLIGIFRAWELVGARRQTVSRSVSELITPNHPSES